MKRINNKRFDLEAGTLLIDRDGCLAEIVEGYNDYHRTYSVVSYSDVLDDEGDPTGELMKSDPRHLYPVELVGWEIY